MTKAKTIRLLKIALALAMLPGLAGADKPKNQRNAQQAGDRGSRLSNKLNAQPIHDDATQDLRSVAVGAQENSVEQPNEESRPPQNRQTRKAQPPPQRGGQPEHPQHEQQSKKKKKPEDNPPDQ